jgi:ketosteroid isomerase-like protein
MRPLAALFAAAALPLFPADVEAVKRELLEKDRQFAADAARRGPDGFADWMAESGILKFEDPGDPPLTTREAVRASMKKQFAGRPFNLRWEPLRADAAQSGELGYTFGKWSMTGTDPQGKPLTRTGHYISIWKKQNDGSWKVVVDLGS